MCLPIREGRTDQVSKYENWDFFPPKRAGEGGGDGGGDLITLVARP
jgi:hypothetical protein